MLVLWTILLIYQYQIFKKCRKGMDRSNKKIEIVCECIIANTSGSMLHIPPTNLLLLAAKQEPYKKAYLLTKILEELSGKSSGEWTSRQKKKDKTKRVIGLGRRTREEIVKWNQMTALRFQTRGRHQTSPASLRGGWGYRIQIMPWMYKRSTWNVKLEGCGLDVFESGDQLACSNSTL